MLCCESLFHIESTFSRVFKSGCRCYGFPALILLKFGVEFFADQVEGVGSKSKTKRWLVSFYDLDHCLSCASGIMVIAIIIMMMIIVTATGARRKAA